MLFCTANESLMSEKQNYKSDLQRKDPVILYKFSFELFMQTIKIWQVIVIKKLQLIF